MALITISEMLKSATQLVSTQSVTSVLLLPVVGPFGPYYSKVCADASTK